MSKRFARQPLHRIIDLLTAYHGALGRVHQADTREARLEALNELRACDPAVWQGSRGRDDTVRGLADSAKARLSQPHCRHVRAEDFDLVERGAHILSGFAVSPLPMSMPEVYSERHTPEHELWQQWRGQGEWYMALGELIARLRELAARAGEVWTPAGPGAPGGQRRRGRKADPDIDPKRDKRLCADWAAAKDQGVTRATFCRGRGIRVADLIGAQDREKYRRTRDAE